MPAFSGQLRANEIYATLFNMIISQEVFGDNISGTFSSLVDKSRVDGGLYGDSKLFYSADVLKSRAWGGDTEATNLLQIERPKDPETQEVVLDVFRQIGLTVDEYLSKRAWMGEGAFAKFNSVMLGMIRETKRVYDSTTFNAYVGTAVSAAAINTIQVSPTLGTDTSSADLEGAARIEASAIAQTIADLFIDLKDVSREYNDYGHLRSYDLEDLVVVWNSKWVNKIKKIDLPTMFHNEGLVDRLAEEILPARYFGDILAASHTVAAGEDYRALEEQDITVSGTVYHLFAGDKFPVGAALVAGQAYQVNGDIICKVMHKRSVPFMSAFEASTAFFNARSLTTNHYLTWGHNTIEYLKNYPFITITM